MTHKPNQISSSRLRFPVWSLVWKLSPCLFAKHSIGYQGSIWVPCVCMCACTHHFHRWGSTLPPEGCIETPFLLHEYQPLVIQVERAALSLGSPIVPGRHGCPLNQSERSAPTSVRAETWERKEGKRRSRRRKENTVSMSWPWHPGRREEFKALNGCQALGLPSQSTWGALRFILAVKSNTVYFQGGKWSWIMNVVVDACRTWDDTEVPRRNAALKGVQVNDDGLKSYISARHALYSQGLAG